MSSGVWCMHSHAERGNESDIHPRSHALRGNA